MNAGTHTDQFTSLMDEVQIPCERRLRNLASVARGCMPSVDCEGRNPAEWVLWFRCGCTPQYVLYCTFCKDIVLGAPSLNCGGCGITVPGRMMYRHVEPLNKRSAA